MFLFVCLFVCFLYIQDYFETNSSLFQHYSRSRNVRIYVNQITSPVLGRELVRRCGNEGQHRYLGDTGYTTLRFLRAAISFIPDALDDGANLRNAAFIFAQPGREFLIQAGRGDWEFYFSEDDRGDISGRCVRKPFRRYIWDGCRSIICRVSCAVGGLLPIAGPTLLALAGL